MYGNDRGKITARVEDNTVNNNATTNLVTSLASLNNDMDITISNNQASNAGAGFGLLTVAKVNNSGSGLAGSVFAEYTNNVVNSNALDNINIDIDSFGDRAVATISGNNASSSASGKGIVCSVNAVNSGLSGAGLFSNIANANNGTNIDIDLDTDSGEVIYVLGNNHASSSVTGNGIYVNAVSTEGVVCDVESNTASSNAGVNIDQQINTGGFYWGLNQNNHASSGGLGMRITVSAENSFTSYIRSNTVEGNQSDNMAYNMRSHGDMIIDISRNNISNSVSGAGLWLSALAYDGADMSVNLNENNANGNFQQNIATTLTTSNGNLDVTVSGNKASSSATNCGLTFHATANNSGNVSADIQNNTCNDNGWVNIQYYLRTWSGDITTTVSGNMATSVTGAGAGMEINADARGAGDINAHISNNQAIGNDFENMKIDLDADVDDISVDVVNNTANASSNSLGILLLADSANGNIAADVSGNTAAMNSYHNIELNINSANMLDVTVSGNTTSQSGGIGMLLDGDAGGRINVMALDNVSTLNNNENIKNRYRFCKRGYIYNCKP